MAKALVNKGIPIKADNPKDPYIRDENGIKDIVDSSTVFGKTLGNADGKLQLKNGNTVLSEVTLPGGGTLLKSETTPQIVTINIFYDSAISTWTTDDFYRPDFTGYYYQVEEIDGTPFPQEIITVQMYDMGDPMTTFTLDLREMPAGIDTFYVFGTGVDTVEYYGTEAPVVTTEYDELTLGSGLSVSNGKLNGPNMTLYGKTLNLSNGKYLSLKNGEYILSEVTLPDTRQARFFEVTKDSHDTYHLAEDTSTVTAWINGGADRTTYFYEYATSHDNGERIVYQFYGKKVNPYGGNLYCFYCLDGELDWNQFVIGTLTYRVLILDDNGMLSYWSKSL